MFRTRPVINIKITLYLILIVQENVHQKCFMYVKMYFLLGFYYVCVYLTVLLVVIFTNKTKRKMPMIQKK